MNLTLTGVPCRLQNGQVSGKPANFTPEQIQALRRALRDYHERQQGLDSPWSQKRTADAIGVSQQVAGRLLGKEMAGLSLPTALAIVRLEGFETLDAFFAAHSPSPVNPAAQRGNRDLGIILARRAGMADAAIAAVLDRYASSQYDNRPVKWWLGKFLAEDDDLDLMRPSDPPPAAPAIPASRPATPARRRKAG